MFKLYFNYTIGKALERTIRTYMSECEQIIGSYFKFNQLIDCYFLLDDAPDNYPEYTRSSLRAEEFATGLIVCDVISRRLNKDKFIRSIAHECNHLKLDEIFNTEIEPTLFNWTLAEGLAKTFEMQVASDFNFSWKREKHLLSISKEQLLAGLKEILAYGDNCDYDHYAWFLNFSRRAPYPPNFAYAIGYFLVSKYCHYYQLKPSMAVQVPPVKFHRFANLLVEKGHA